MVMYLPENYQGDPNIPLSVYDRLGIGQTNNFIIGDIDALQFLDDDDKEMSHGYDWYSS